MNYQLYKKARNKILIKSFIFIFLILGLAVFSTYKIYYKFQSTRDKISSSPALTVTYHGKQAENVKITKVTPVTDSVGLSSNAYKLTIKNNTGTKVKYRLVLKDDEETYKKDSCDENKIPDNIIKVGIHTSGEVSKIFNLDDLENRILDTAVISPQTEENYTVRFWISKNTLPTESDMHFHGILVVEEIH